MALPVLIAAKGNVGVIGENVEVTGAVSAGVAVLTEADVADAQVVIAAETDHLPHPVHM